MLQILLLFFFCFNWGLGVMVFNATFNNTLVILWLSVLLVQKTRVPGENHRPAASHWQTLSHECCHRIHLARVGFKLTIVVIGTDCIGSCISNYHTITTITAPCFNWLYKTKTFCKNKLHIERLDNLLTGTRYQCVFINYIV